MANKATYDLIKQYEDLRLRAYRCPAGIPTIGYGHTKNVSMGDVITIADAQKLFDEDILIFESRVCHFVKVKLTENQKGALISFAYNVIGWEKSTLLKKLNAGDYVGAANEFVRWNKAHVKGKLVVLNGLTKRREAERQLFLTV